MNLPRNVLRHIGEDVVVQMTGLRNSCKQFDNFKSGLMKAVLDRDSERGLVHKAGIMDIVINDGLLKAGDKIRIEYPNEPQQNLEPV